MAQLFALSLLLIQIAFTFSRVVLVHNTNWFPHAGNPGVKLRLTRKGADHVKEVGVKLLSEQLANLQGFRVQHFFQQPGLSGWIYVNDIRTLGYQPPSHSKIEFAAPSFITFAIENMAISLAGRFLGVSDSGLFSVPGQMNAQLSGMSVSLTTSFRVTPDGTMAVNVINCTTLIQQSNFVLSPEGPLSTLVKAFEIQINDLIRQRIPGIFCQGLTNIIEQNSPALFQRLNRAQLTEHFKNFNNDGVIENFIRRFTAGLYIDGHQIADPVVTNEYFETQQSGELKYNHTIGSAPFFPRPIPVDHDSDRMLYLYGSEYTLNSLLYHAYESDRLMIKIEQSTLPSMYRGFVRTSCSDSTPVSAGGADHEFLSSICVGKLIPNIEEHFPNTTTKFALLSHGIPEVKFVDEYASMDIRTRILTYVDDRGQDRQILVSSADGLADIKLNADDGKFSGDLKLRKLNVRLHRSAIGGISAESIEQLAPLAKTFLGPQLSRGLKQGLPYPLKDSITFIDPKLTIHDGFVRLATDFVLGEENLRQKVHEGFERIKNS
ncbi:LBP / BPI / CETP family protein [Aphelenchoides besseyi]|nr:LBP / BPI / CETP family protein [Aphelenchoides besseyi]KAI6211847.1 LBP / BPI / CETP family protein [Aphelenchoides besseyi]